MRKTILLIIIILTSLLAHSLSYGDSVHITVFNVLGQEEINEEFQVNYRNELILPYIGGFNVEDMTLNQIKDEIFKRLDPDVIKSPLIYLNTDGFHFNISGEIKNEGKFSFNKKIRLSEALNMAGGLLESSDKYKILVVNGEKMRSYDYSSFMKHGDYMNNPIIEDGDTIILKELPYIYVVGEVNNPFKVYYDDTISPLDLAILSKPKERAALNYAIILRKEKEKVLKLNINLANVMQRGRYQDFPSLLPGDILFIPKNRGSALDMLTNTIEKFSNIFVGAKNVKTISKEDF